MSIKNFFALFGAVALLCGCAWAPRSTHYRETYAHLQSVPTGEMTSSDYQLVILVCARHLDYSKSQALLKTVAKHPQDGSLTGDVGHSWLLLKGPDGVIEGGHSGELGLSEPKYFDGIMDLIEAGDPNPVRYMHASLKDGYFEKGSGGFSPTYAIKKDLTHDQYEKIRSFIARYDYTDYSLTRRQCLLFVQEIARIAGLNLQCHMTVPVGPYVRVGNQFYRVWTDETYSTLELMSPDILEKNMMEAVYQGEAEYALDWYRKYHDQGGQKVQWCQLLQRLAKVYLL